MSRLVALVVEGQISQSRHRVPSLVEARSTTQMSTSRHIRLSITREPNMEADVNLAKVSIRERLMRFLFGP